MKLSVARGCLAVPNASGEAKAPARQWFDEAIGNQRIKAARSRWKSSDQQARNAAAVTGWSLARSTAMSLPRTCRSVPRTSGRVLPSTPGLADRRQTTRSRPWMGHRSQEGDDAWQTSVLVP